MARAKRANETALDPHLILSQQPLSTQPDSTLLKVEDQSLFSQIDLHPIVFEECYVKNDDSAFVRLVKQQSVIYTEEQMMAYAERKQLKTQM